MLHRPARPFEVGFIEQSTDRDEAESEMGTLPVAFDVLQVLSCEWPESRVGSADPPPKKGEANAVDRSKPSE